MNHLSKPVFKLFSCKIIFWVLQSRSMVYFVAFAKDIICVLYIRDRIFIGLGSFSETTLTVKSKPTEQLHGCTS